MARYNAVELVWAEVEVLGKRGLFSELRVNKDTIPEGYYMYEARHSDEDWGEPCEIAEWIMVNFFGTLLMKEPLENLTYQNALEKNYVFIDSEKDWMYVSSEGEL